MTANLSLVIRHEALARRGETIYEKRYQSEDQRLSIEERKSKAAQDE